MSISLSSTRTYIARATSTIFRRGAPTTTRNAVLSSSWSNSLLVSDGQQQSNCDSFDNFTDRFWRKNALTSNAGIMTLSLSRSIDCSKTMMHSILETIASNTIGRPFSVTLNHPNCHEFPLPLSTSAIEIIPTYVENHTKMDLDIEECGYLEEGEAFDGILPGNSGAVENDSVWLISTLKRRKKKMNKHKLRKRRKKLRFKTRK